MRNLISIVGKNLKILSRSKLSSLIIIVAPLILILLAGNAFNSSSLNSVVVGTYSNEYSELSNNILNSFEDNSFKIEKLNSEDSCINSVKSGDSQICVVFPEKLSTEGNLDSINFHVDDSRMNIAYTLINKMDSQISSKSSELGITMAGDLINAIDEARTTLPEKEMEILSARNNISDIKLKGEEIFLDSNVTDNFDRVDDAIDVLSADLNGTDSLDNLIEEIANLSNSISKISEKAEQISLGGKSGLETLDQVGDSLNLLIGKINNVKVLDAEKVVSPLKTKIKKINSDSDTNWNYLFPTLIALVILFGSIILSSTLVLREKNTKAYFRNFTTPTSDFTFLLGIYASCLVILAVQLTVLFVGSTWLTEINLVDSLSKVLLVLFLSSSVFIFLGMFIGYSFRSEETSILAAIGVASLLMFFSNTIFPVEAISASLKNIAVYNPLVITDSLLKKMILFDSSLPPLLNEFLILGGFLFSFMLVSLLSLKISKRRS
jgi:hypothetical protein